MFFDDYSKGLQETLDKISREDVQLLYSLIDEARNKDKHVFVLGNGGSAAAASHWVCDFGKGINIPGAKRLKIFAPVDNGAVFSAYGNDNSYEETFVEQLKNLLEEGDLIISLSVSGNSGNLLESHRYAKSIGAKTVCIVGDKQGKLIDMSDKAIVIKSENYGIVEDIHIIIEHAMSQYMKSNNEEAVRQA
ncbi:SIS domain-containing protein [Ohessyouella blattaphilus]|uniref:SIS domain-containing protein n=1 Tax=Ohessyouella blattaphilus TaxID=2949333 RepID=A0ABT1EPE3_9FIRM|nr:SIS domain-containing protein [Ohessyouella blattaphilus]MCP1111152.1 SIS domain-containing protein [Ohessyouella blattaphilus]MCR8564546.1 SIS domain-containing protein [Ohessyouella blattaphilus]